MDLILHKQFLDKIIEHSKQGYPNEVCGMLSGTEDGAVKKIYKMSNINETPDSYLMATEEQFKVLKEIDKEDMLLLAIYHSHPYGQAYPSQTDCELAFYPDAMYVIISLIDSENPVVRSFSIVENNITEEKIIYV